MTPSRLLAVLALAAVSLAGIAAPAVAATAHASDRIPIYTLPNDDSRLLGVLQAGEEVTLDRCNAQGTWCRVFHDGPTGWVLASFLIGAQAKIDATPGRSLTDPPFDQDEDLGHNHTRF